MPDYYSDIVPDLSVPPIPQIDARRAGGGRARPIVSRLAIANGLAAGRWFIAREVDPNHYVIPQSHGTGLMLGMIRYAQIAGLSALDFGFANCPGATDTPDAFTADLNITGGAGVASFKASPTLAMVAQPLWQLAGLSKSPDGPMDLTMTMNAGAGGAGDIVVQLLLAAT